MVSPISPAVYERARARPFGRTHCVRVRLPSLSLQVDDRAVHMFQLSAQIEKHELDLKFIVHFLPSCRLISRMQSKNKKKSKTILSSGQATA
jgi:hypothetical protein